jgi:3-deoxy-7-phosphoheptulonate synthase
MIIELNKNTSKETIEYLANKYRAFHIFNDDKNLLITSASVKELDNELSDHAEKQWVFATDMQLSSRDFQETTREIKLKDGLSIGGNQKNTLLIGGPCSVESEDQIRSAAELLKDLNLSVLRGGCYKPRTSPYSFQGMGIEGLHLLSKMREEFGHLIISEVRDATHVAEIIEHTDIIQIGAKAMYDQGILRACAKTQKPVMIKRGFGTTLQEFTQAAEFILSGGNSNVILCERGIRTFETKTRFTLDLCGVAWLQEHTNLPIILDPSHAMGYAYGVPALTKACMAMNVEGLIIETHPTPSLAKSDASQQLDFDAFKGLYNELQPLAECLGRKIR